MTNGGASNERIDSMTFESVLRALLSGAQTLGPSDLASRNQNLPLRADIKRGEA